MARNRVIYQSQAVYCSQTAYNEPQIASGAIEPLQRVQSRSTWASILRDQNKLQHVANFATQVMNYKLLQTLTLANSQNDV